MTFDSFKKSIDSVEPPKGIDTRLRALWYDGKGDWHMAHTIAQDINTTDGSWIHAYLHRKEGDEGNAAYWYRRAGKRFPDITLDEEWKALVEEFL